MTIDPEIPSQLGPGIFRTPLPQGFNASGINCGVRKYRPDLGVIISEPGATAAGVFTQNECKAAPVLYSQRLLPSRQIRAIITNSGEANAATSEQGREDNWKMALAAANSVGCLPHQILTASTGKIGIPLSINPIVASMSALVDQAQAYAENFAVAIMTTDLVPKAVSVEVALSEGVVRITGIAKGSGMIHPNMATMLGYLLTDVAMDVDLADTLLREATDVSFNMISVDGDMSTNDCCFLLANGASGVTLANDEDLQKFKQSLFEVAKLLAQAIARDGEGATKLIEVNLKGATSTALAKRAARGITVSPLFKSAIHGEDPNWGRLLARLGAEQVPASSLEKMSLSIQNILVFRDGKPVEFDRLAASRALRQDTIRIHANFHSGEGEATAWGCDLSKKYVDINAEYS